MAPKVTKPTSAFCGIIARDCCSESLACSSSSSMSAMSRTSRKTGGWQLTCGMMYSMVEHAGSSSAGRFTSVMCAA